MADRLLHLAGEAPYEAFSASDGARRFYESLPRDASLSPEHHQRRMALYDIVEEIPALAVAAFTGLVMSGNPEERLDSLMYLPLLGERHPQEAQRLAAKLAADPDAAVAAQAQAVLKILAEDQAATTSGDHLASD